MSAEPPTLRQLEYAVLVAQHRHFGRAAEAALVSQPGLSGQIKELERRLGVELFERTPRGVLITDAGARVVELAKPILRQVEHLSLVAGEQDGAISGRLRVAAIPTMAPYLLPDLVKSILAESPGVQLDIQEMQTAVLVEAIEDGEVDLGLLATPFHTASLHMSTVTFEPFHLAVPIGHRLAESAEPVPLSLLGDLKVLLLPEGHCLRDHAMSACELAGRVEQSEVHATSLATLTQMVAAGIGVTLLPATALEVEARPGNGIAVRPFQAPQPGRQIALGWRSTDPRSQAFDGLANRLGAALNPG